MGSVLRNAVEARYGSRRGLARAIIHWTGYRLGLLAAYRAIQWRHVERLVFVCKGNICRSPYAETIAAARGMPSTSFGLEARTGAAAHHDAIRNANARGVDLGRHRARTLEDIALAHGDLLVGMEPVHAHALRRIAEDRGIRAQTTLLGIWARDTRPYLADPYGRTDAYFQTCYSVIDAAIERIQDRLREAGPD